MNLAIVGCGYVFDIYMRTYRAYPDLKIIGVYDKLPERSLAVSDYYGFPVYPDYMSMLSDPQVNIVVNLTSIESHHEISKQALLAGKHVYSEKPLATDQAECSELFELAEEKGLVFSGAPGNIFSDTVRTMLATVNSGEIGKPLLVYAELDDNPIQHMRFDRVSSPTGAPWPLEEEIKQGCTFEHAGYHLIWICALLGPAVSVTAFSAELIPNKLTHRRGKVGTPDYSVASLLFANGAVARITCSVVAPRDHRMRIIGEAGEVSADSYRQFRAPVYLEKFSQRSLNARKFRSLRNNSAMSRLFGIGGQRVRLARNPRSHAVEGDFQARATLRTRLVEWLRRKQVYAQDKFAAVAEMACSIQKEEEQFLTPEFLRHINELTLVIQNAGPHGVSMQPSTSFEPLSQIPGTKI